MILNFLSLTLHTSKKKKSIQNKCLIELIQLKIICAYNTLLIDTKSWSFITYGDETISPPDHK